LRGLRRERLCSVRMRQVHCRVEMFQQMSPSLNSPFKLIRNRYPKKWRSGERHGNRAWIMSTVSAGISSFKRAVASSRVQPLNIRNVRSAAAARRIGRLPPEWPRLDVGVALTLAQRKRDRRDGGRVMRRMPGSVHSLRVGDAGAPAQNQKPARPLI
jgi:hypothetical protein